MFQKKAEAAHRILEGLGPHVELVRHINGTTSLEYYLGHLCVQQFCLPFRFGTFLFVVYGAHSGFM